MGKPTFRFSTIEWVESADSGRSRDDDGSAKVDPKLTYIMALGFMRDAGAGSRGRLEFVGDLFETR